MSDRSAPIMDHIGEVKSRLIRTMLVVLAMTIVAFVFHEKILEFLLAPAEALNPVTEGKPVFTELTEFWGATAKVSVLTGFAMSLPFFLWQVVMFLRPGLTPVERRYLYLLAPGGLLAFAAGVAFAYYVLLPPAIGFLLSFGGDVATPLIRIGSYVTLITTLLFWMGLIFELPIVIFFMTRIGVAEHALAGPATEMGDSARLRAWRADHADVRSGEPGSCRTPHNRLVRSRLLAGEAW